jgi:very-short-patch-repair endonuclease
MSKIKDLTGQRFGRLTVIKYIGTKNQRPFWECLCDCGNTKEIVQYSLTMENGTKSCGKCLRREDLTGKRFGMLTVLKYIGRKKGGYIWRCLCDCGNTKDILSNSLKRKIRPVKSCGCLLKSLREGENLIGKKFHRLKVIKKDNEKYNYKRDRKRWICLCDCGNIKRHISSDQLKRGTVKSCGCLRKETTSNICRKNIIGKKFGKLTVEKYLYSKHKTTYWLCKCECGNEKITSSCSLVTKSCQSCGCIISNGNNKIKKILELLNLKFKQEKRFKKCKNKGLLRFDFYLPDYNLCIEFQGKQHYEYGIWGKKTKRQEMFELVQLHDQIKRDFCKQEGVELLEICYKDYDRIEEILREKLNIPKNEVQQC